jgi:hypothetical protein
MTAMTDGVARVTAIVPGGARAVTGAAVARDRYR